jgi:signal peptidase I
MLGKRRSYAEAVQGRRRTTRRLGTLLILFLCYELISGLLLTAYSMKSQSMSPTVLVGDRIIATPLAFGPHSIFGRMPGFTRPVRGDIVVAEPNYARRAGFFMTLYDSFVRFVTFQLFSPALSGLDGTLSAPTLLRVVGVPGDSLVMDDFIFKVKPADSEQYLTEFELSSSRYDISHEDAPQSWSAALPGSGHMSARLLGKDEYFLAGDARASSGDSRLWGPVRIDRFRAKALLRYWPPKRFGTL